jgi:hypothetical protein
MLGDEARHNTQIVLTLFRTVRDLASLSACDRLPNATTSLAFIYCLVPSDVNADCPCSCPYMVTISNDGERSL